MANIPLKMPQQTTIRPRKKSPIIPVYRRDRVPKPPTVPGVMFPPSMTASSHTAILVHRASDPSDGGSAITSYDFRHSTDGQNWTEVLDISQSFTLQNLQPDTMYFGQNRANNAIGNGAWSADAAERTHTAPVGPTIDITNWDEPTLEGDLETDLPGEGNIHWCRMTDGSSNQPDGSGGWINATIEEGTVPMPAAGNPAVIPVDTSEDGAFTVLVYQRSDTGADSNVDSVQFDNVVIPPAPGFTVLGHETIASGAQAGQDVVSVAFTVPPGQGLIIGASSFFRTSAGGLPNSQVITLAPASGGAGGNSVVEQARMSPHTQFGAAIWFIRDVDAADKDGSDQCILTLHNPGAAAFGGSRIHIWHVTGIQATALVGSSYGNNNGNGPFNIGTGPVSGDDGYSFVVGDSQAYADLTSATLGGDVDFADVEDVNVTNTGNTHCAQFGRISHIDDGDGTKVAAVNSNRFTNFDTVTATFAKG